MEIFCEYMVERKMTVKETAIRMGSIAAGILLTLLIMLFLFGRIYGLEVFIIAGIWYGVKTVFTRTNIEFEYILTNSTMDIDKIMSKKARKRMITIDFKHIETCEPANKIETPAGVKVMDFTGDISLGGVYYADFFKNSEKIRVYFQPNARILNDIKAVNPRQVTISEGDVQ